MRKNLALIATTVVVGLMTACGSGDQNPTTNRAFLATGAQFSSISFAPSGNAQVQPLSFTIVAGDTSMGSFRITNIRMGSTPYPDQVVSNTGYGNGYNYGGYSATGSLYTQIRQLFTGGDPALSYNGYNNYGSGYNNNPYMGYNNPYNNGYNPYANSQSPVNVSAVDAAGQTHTVPADSISGSVWQSVLTMISQGGGGYNNGYPNGYNGYNGYPNGYNPYYGNRYGCVPGYNC